VSGKELEFRNNLINAGYDGVVSKESPDQYVAFFPNQIKSATDNNGNFDDKSDDVRFMLVGEKGAANLDKAEEASTRVDNLDVARQMETAEKDAKAIKMATGWERGADGEWRYEIPDFKSINKEVYNSLHGGETYNTVKLPALIGENNDLFKSYPQLREIDAARNNINDRGVFSPDGNGQITINERLTSLSAKSTLIHEIQHAIQDIEGFAQGTSPNIDHRDRQIKDLNEAYALVDDKVRRYIELKGKERYGGIDKMPIDEVVELSKLEKDEDVKKADNALREVFKKYGSNMDVVSFENGQAESFYKDASTRRYFKSAGEVEARNVSRRMGMTPEERRASLAAETEDVAREDQIFIYDSMGSQKDLERSGKNSNFAPQKNEKDNGRQEGKETRMDNGRTMGESALRGLVGEQPQGRRVRQTISEASAYERGDNGTPAQKGRGSWSKERFLGALEISAIKNGTWIDDIHTVAEKAISKGQENEVYRSLDNKHVIKVNNLSLSDAEYDFDNFIDRLQSHNELFGNATYKIIGFAENSLGEVSVVLEQPFIDGINATQREIDDYLSSVGFHKTTISDGEKGWTNGKYELWDAEPRNVLKDKNGNLYFIDTVVNSAKSGAESENLSSLEGLEIIDAPKHDFKNIAEARIWAKENITGTYRNADTGEDISVSSTAIGKYLSEKAIGKSDSLDAHLSALKQLPKLIETSVLRDAHKDRNNDTNIREIQRLYGAINYEWKNYPVKITVKVYQSENNKAYSYEVMQIENPVGTLGDHMQHADFLPRTTGFHVNESRGKGRTISENNNKKSTSDTKNDRFHTEAEQQADEISDWLDGFEGGAPRFQTVTPNLPNKKPTKPTTPTTPYLVEASRTREKYQDRAIKVRREEEELRKRGVKISIDQSAYEGIDKVPSRIMTKTNKMMDELYRPLDATIVEVRKILPADMVNQRTEELKKDLEESRKRIDDLKKAIKSEKDDKERDLLKTELRKEKNKAKIIKSQRDNGAYNVIGRYFIALHAPERNAYLKKTEGVNDGSGMSNADAAKIVANFEKVVPKNLVDKLKSQMSAIRDFNLDNMLHYGRITQAEYAELKTRYQYYVSLKGWEAKDEGYELQNYIDDGRSTGGGAYNILRHAEGRGSMADNPIDNMLQNSMNIISWGEKNNVKQKAYFIASANQQHDDLFSVDFIPKQNIEDFEAGQKDVEVWIAGEKHVIHYQQSEIANILNGAYGDDVYSAKWQNTFLAKATRYMSAINTAKNPRFAYKNAKRDIQQSAQRILIEDGPAMAGKFMRLEPTAVAALTKEVTSGGKKHLNKQIVGRDIYDAKKTFDVAELYQEFLLNGAVTGFIQSRKMEDVKKNIQKELNRAAGDVWFGKKAWDAANGLLDGMAEISESSTRFAVYMTYRTSGKTIAEATRKAKEATVNFNRKGERTAAWGALISFFNASIQSAENTYSLATRHPGWYLATAAAHAAKGFLMYKLSTMILQAMADGADDDDEKNRILDMLKDMTNYREYINFTIPIPWGDKNKVYTIPMSHAWRPFHALGVMTAQKMEGSISNKEFVENMVSLVSGSISPFDASSPRSFLPTFLTPITDVYFFNSDFMGIPITKEMFTKDLEENTKHLYKARQGTAPIFTEASKLAVRMAGFDPDNPDMREIDKSGGLKRLWTGLNLNPSRMEHLVRGFAGGVGKFFVDIATATAGIIEGTVDSIKGEEADFFPGGVNSIPLNDSVHEPYDSGFSRRKFYEMRKHLYDWEKTADEWEYKNDKTLTGDKVKTLDELLEKMHGYDNAIGILFDDIEDQRDKIADKKKRLKESVSNLRKRQLEAEIKAAETIIETKKKEQIRGYRKAYKELNPVFREMGVQYAK
jgi:hypothetical protein